MNRFVVIAIGITPPHTMGGNSKIILEVLRNFPASQPCLVVTSKPETFAVNGIRAHANLQIDSVPPFPRNERLHHLAMCRHYTQEIGKVFAARQVGPGDVVYCVSDFFNDVVPAFVLQKRHGYAWVPSFFLFVPFVIENLRKRIGFPVLKYLVYYVYQRVALWMMLLRCSGVVVTNATDKRRFPPRLRERILPIYGGVNVEQISEGPSLETRFDALFCSRLHPQKGISGLLDIWRQVVRVLPSARLGIIGNGEPAYERLLREKASRLGLDRNLEWLGYVNHEAKFALYRQARLFVHATVYDNNGMVAAEALCAGLPVVLYDLAPLRHVYDEGCLKIAEGRGDLYAEAVVRLLTDDAFRQATRPTPAQVARLRAHWDWKHRTQLFVNFLSGLKRRPTRRLCDMQHGSSETPPY